MEEVGKRWRILMQLTKLLNRLSCIFVGLGQGVYRRLFLVGHGPCEVVRFLASQCCCFFCSSCLYLRAFLASVYIIYVKRKKFLHSLNYNTCVYTKLYMKEENKRKQKNKTGKEYSIK